MSTTPFNLTDRYLLTSHLARGGMADVYQGQDELLGRKVAVKVLHSQLSNDDAFVKRFRKEAQAAANLSHPNIVGIYDWGQIDSTYFIVMELVDGRSLREVLKSDGSLLPRRAVEIAADVAAALSVAHRAGLVHRDIKPGNILLAPDGTVKVTDFGIARAWDDSQELTKTGAVMGTATYFSPEQAQGHVADERSDVYSLGVVLYEMLTGAPPFRGDSPMAVAFQHVSQTALAPSAVNPDVSPELDAIVLKAMQKDPAARYQTAEEARADLWRVLQGDRPRVSAVAAPSEDATRAMTAAVPPATVPPDQAYRVLEEPPSSNLAFVVGTFALLATLAGLIYLVLQLLNQPAAPEATLIEIPSVENIEQNEALRRLGSLGLITQIQNESSDTIQAGRVTRTDPPGGTEVADRSTILVFVSTGVEQFGVPSVEGLTQADAEDLIRRQGFEVGNITSEPSDVRPEGTVVSQFPVANSQVTAGTAIDLVISTGPEQVVLTNLVGMVEREATGALESLGLTWLIQSESSEEVERGRVIRTDPTGGTAVAPGTEVTVVISEGPAPVAVPDLTGFTQDAALTRLQELGLLLQVAAARIEVTDPNFFDRVVGQTPGPTELVPAGTTVVVTLGSPPATTTTTVPPDTTPTTVAP